MPGTAAGNRRVLGAAMRYLSSRFPWHSHGIAALAGFACSVCAFELAAPGGVTIEPGEAAGLVATVLLFLHLRLVDDLDDVRQDLPPGTSRAVLRAVRRPLLVAVVAVELLVLALTAAWPVAAAIALGALSVTVLTPFVLVRLFRENKLLLAPWFEGGPLLIFVFGFVLWRETTGRNVPPAAAAGVIVTFWAGYEFWKFSRKVGEDAYQPYGLGARGLYAVCWSLLAVCAAGMLAFGWFADPRWFFTACGFLVPLVFGAWMTRFWPDPGAPVRAHWRGLLLVESLMFVVVAGALLAAAGVR